MAGRDKKVGASLRHDICRGNGNCRAEKGSTSVRSRCDDYWKGQCFLDDKNIFFDFDMVIIDELSSFKSPKAQRFKDLKKSKADGKTCGRAYGNTGKPHGLMGRDWNP